MKFNVKDLTIGSTFKLVGFNQAITGIDENFVYFEAVNNNNHGCLTHNLFEVYLNNLTITSLEILPTLSQLEKELFEKVKSMSCQLNLAALRLRQSDFDKTADDCNEASNYKSLFVKHPILKGK